MWGGKQLVQLGGQGTAVVSVASTGVKYYIAVPYRCRPIRVGFTITTAITITAAVVKFNRITYTATGSSTTGDSDVGQITLPISAYAYKCYYDETDASTAVATDTWAETLSEGDVVVVNCTTAATAGEGLPFIVVEVDNERPANNTNMVKSA
jgi:hypothetical protein